MRLNISKPLLDVNKNEIGTIKLEAVVSTEVPTWIISFPKSGRTWVRALIGRYLTHAHSIDHRLSIDTVWITTALQALGCCRLVMFDHLQSEQSTPYTGQVLEGMLPIENCNIVFMVRDLRDLIVSWYFERAKRFAQYHPEDPYTGSISEFIRDELIGCPKVISFLNFWAARKKLGVIAYEFLHKDTELVFRRMLHILNIQNIKDESVQEALRWASFENMRKLEANGTWKGYLTAMTPGDVNDPESYKLRKGKIGGYKDYLSSEDIKYVESMMESNVWQKMYLEGLDV